jgi:hypothetical protein
MSEIKYEIIKKIGVLSSPLCPLDIYHSHSVTLRVRCPPNSTILLFGWYPKFSSSDLGENTLWEFSNQQVFWSTYDR